MRRVLIGAAATAILVAAGVAGFWVWGARRLDAEIDARLARFAEAGVQVATAARAVTGFPFAWRLEAEGVTVADEAGLWRFAAPAAVAETGAADGARVNLRLPQGATLDLGENGGRFAVAAEGLALEPFAAEGDRPRIVATTLALSPVGAAEGAAPRLTLAGVALEQRRPEGRGRAALMRAERLELAAGEAGALRLDGVAATVEADGLAAPSLAAFQAARGAASLEILAERGMLTRETPAPIAAETGPARILARLDAAGLAVTGAAEQARSLSGPPGVVTIGALEAGMTLPLRAGPEPGRYALRLALRDATGDRAFWAAFDPGEALSRAPAAFVAEISGEADLRDALDPAARGRLAARTVEIETVVLDALGAHAEATGLLRVRPGQPTPDGDIALRIEGWRPLLAALRESGLVGPAQVDLAERLAETFGQPGQPDDALVSDISLRDGAVFANGAPVR